MRWAGWVEDQIVLIKIAVTHTIALGAGAALGKEMNVQESMLTRSRCTPDARKLHQDPAETATSPSANSIAAFTDISAGAVYPTYQFIDTDRDFNLAETNILEIAQSVNCAQISLYNKKLEFSSGRERSAMMITGIRG
jgi:hypothetical protein